MRNSKLDADFARAMIQAAVIPPDVFEDWQLSDHFINLGMVPTSAVLLVLTVVVIQVVDVGSNFISGNCLEQNTRCE